MAEFLHHAVSLPVVAGLAALWGIKAVAGLVTWRAIKRRRSRVRG